METDNGTVKAHNFDFRSDGAKALDTELAATSLPDLKEHDPNAFAMKLDEMRQKALAGTMTLEESREAIQYLRAARVHAADLGNAKKAASGRKSPAKAAKQIDSDALLDELEGL
jgi:hypothetical protein